MGRSLRDPANWAWAVYLRDAVRGNDAEIGAFEMGNDAGIGAFEMWQ